jgi:hypothetical protein
MLEEETMKFRGWQSGAVLALFAGLALIAAGCSQAENKGGQAKDKGAMKQDKPVQVADAKKDDKTKDDHSGWWCDEHGVPEEVCSMCSAKVAAEFKKKDDWCNEHDRAKSQCFQCDPKLQERFAAQYRAKYGKEPPPTEEEKKKDDKKG